MAKSNKFYFWEERMPNDDDAPSTLRIMGNVTELRKLVKLIEESISWANDPTCKIGFSEDDVDEDHVVIDAYQDGVRIKPEPLSYNPFDGWEL